MKEEWKIDNKVVAPIIENEDLTIDLNYGKGDLSEVQPVLSFDSVTLSNDSLEAYEKAIKRDGRYKQIDLQYSFAGKKIFDGYLTDIEYIGQRDQIRAKPLVSDGTDSLSEKLSAIDSALLKSMYTYKTINFLIEKVDTRPEKIQLTISILFYSYVLYTQIKEVARLANEAIEAATNAAPPGLALGSAIALALNLIAAAAFVATTIIQLIKFFKQLKELIIATVHKTKVISMKELCRAPLEYIGYNLITDIEDMDNVHHWASGNVFNGEYYPRSSDVCGTALGCINLSILKFNARVFVRDKNVYIVKQYSPLLYNKTAMKLLPFPEGNYKENLDDMVGTREHIYSVDYNDEWTLESFKGTEYIVRANISDPKKSTIKGIKQKNYGVSLCNRKDSLNDVEKLWKEFANLANSVISLFGGSSQSINLKARIGAAKISSSNLSVAKLVWIEGNKIPSDHRSKLSAKADEEKFHWVESHVRNPRAKKRIYTNIVQEYDENSLSCNLSTNVVYHPDGTAGEISNVSWEKSKDFATMSFEIEDVKRDIRLIETFEEPNK